MKLGLHYVRSTKNENYYLGLLLLSLPSYRLLLRERERERLPLPSRCLLRERERERPMLKTSQVD